MLLPPLQVAVAATAAAIARSFGRSAASMAWLRAFSQPVPEAGAVRAEAAAVPAVAVLLCHDVLMLLDGAERGRAV